MLSGLPSTLVLEISKHLDYTSAFRLAQSAREFYSLLVTEVKTKRRLHCLRISLVRLRFLNLKFGDKEYTESTTQWYFNLPREPLVMMCVLRCLGTYEYNGAPEYLMNFKPQSYDFLENLVLSYENHMIGCFSHMYTLVNAAPTDALLDLMFNWQSLVLDVD